MLGLCGCVCASVAADGRATLVEVCGLLVVVEHRLRKGGSSSFSTWVAKLRLSRPQFLQGRWDPARPGTESWCPLHGKMDS